MRSIECDWRPISAFVLFLLATSGFSINVPDVYQESSLRPYRTYSDVAVFHYYVPTQVTRATWEFAAFMDDKTCTARDVFVHIQHGSYPVVNPDNASLPSTVSVDSGRQVILGTTTKFESHEAVVFQAFNPLPGSWFAVAYIPDWNRQIAMQGLGHRCQYSLGSVASWSQHLDITLLTPRMPIVVATAAQYTYFKFYVPENVWWLEVSLSNCSVQTASNARGEGTESVGCCVQGFGCGPDSLPFPAEVNVTEGRSYSYSRPQPKSETYHYVVVVSSVAVTFTIAVEIKGCVYSSSPGSLFRKADVTTGTSSMGLAFASRHSNQSVNLDWKDSMRSTNVPMSVVPHRLNVVVRDADVQDAVVNADTMCFPLIHLARIKHAQDFTDTFLLQGKDRYTSLLGVSDTLPVILKLELLQFVDIGGTLQVGASLVEPPEKILEQIGQVTICVNYGKIPSYTLNGIVCEDGPLETLSTATLNSVETVRYFPFPRPGQWYISLEVRCYSANDTNSTSPEACQFDMLMMFMNVRLLPCVVNGEQVCGGHGLCEENHRGQFFFSTCKCVGGWRGWACTDGSRAIPGPLLLVKTLLLTVSNIFFAPAVVMAIRRKLYTEAVVYGFTMFFSTFYHACDEELFSFCLMKYEVLQFCDFYSAILSFWVTLIAMANLPSRLVSVAHMVGALGIALGVEYQRMGLWVFVAPVGSGVFILAASWGQRCRREKVCYPAKVLWLASLLPGTLLAITGLLLFAFVETEENYKYVHSMWHVVIALSIVFLLPRAQETPSVTTNNESELVDVSEYSITSDFQQLLGR